MMRLPAVALALLILAPALMLPGGCSSVPSEEEAVLNVFDRIAYLFTQYASAYAKQDLAALGILSADLNRLATGHMPKLLAGIASSDEARQGYAAFALGFSKDPAAVEPLLKATAHPDDTIRSHAIVSLGFLGFDTIPMEPFHKLLEDKVPEVRHAALVGLRPMVNPTQDRGMLEAVHKRLSDPDINVRNETLILLRKLARKESIDLLLAGPVKDPEALLRSNAALALGSMGKAALAANPHLIEMLKDETSKVVESAWVSLNRINEKDFDRSYATWRDWYEDEQRHHFSCVDHREVGSAVMGDCPVCGKKLERLPKEGAKKTEPPPVTGHYVCPVHPEIQTSTPARCGKAGCGKELVARKPDPVTYVCPEHPEVVTGTPAKCGKPGCGKELVPKK